VAFKLLPAPGAVVSLCLRGLDDGRAVAAMSAALGSPFEVSGAAHWPGEGTFLRVEGFAQSVAYRTGQLARLLAGYGPVEVEEDGAAQGRWAAIRDVAALAGRAGDVWCLSVRPSLAADLVGRSGAEARLYDWGGGRVWLLMPEGADLRARLGAHPGHATLVRASAETRAAIAPFPPEPAALAALTAGLRARFDPRSILNPGLMA
jgi:glycolate oxidase FAD binding subunit